MSPPVKYKMMDNTKYIKVPIAVPVIKDIADTVDHPGAEMGNKANKTEKVGRYAYKSYYANVLTTEEPLAIPERERISHDDNIGTSAGKTTV